MIRSALVVVDPYASLIVSGEKTLELRAAPTRKRELVGIIRKGSGFIVGLARVSGCSGPLGDAELDALRELAAWHMARDQAEWERIANQPY